VGHWADGDDGVVTFASGRRLRAREMARAIPAGREPEFGICASRVVPRLPSWPLTWIPWAQSGLPVDRVGAESALREAWRRCADERVELACVRGLAPMGTALACIAVLTSLGACLASYGK
jgi:hypothetical protein